MLKLLERIEAAGRKLPHPTLAFASLCGLVLLASAVLQLFGIAATHPVTNEIIQAKSLLSEQGILYILTNTVSNFMNFAPLGPVLVAMLGIGLADHSGYLPKAVQVIAERAPKALLSYSMVLTGVLSNLAADAGYVVLIPLAAFIYTSFGRHPLSGIAAAFAGVSGGYSANLLIGPVDIILTGLTLEAAQILEPATVLAPSSNYWFLLASTFLIMLVGGIITDKVVEPYLNKSQPITLEINSSVPTNNNAAFKIATWVGFLYTAVITAVFVFEWLAFQQALKGLVVLISLGFALVGITYGVLEKANKKNANESQHWIVNSLETSFANLAGYLVLMFFAAQFVAYFNWTQIGLISAIKSAQILTAWELPATALLILVVFASASINLFIGSASAKWALMAPILVPMLMLLGIDPAYSQLAYRIGDSSTNIITPLMPYFALILAYTQQHQKTAHLGTLIAMMIPYSLSFLFSWVGLLLIWLAYDLPIGF